ncbi:TPA: hypothetical protein R8E83_003592 [Escherichia coli]|nr:hypothetical protein [Escherichia coli]
MRKPDWQIKLGETIAAATERPFLWGEHDCCLFAADCAVVVCGIDPAEKYRGTYSDALGARKALLKNHKTIDAAIGAYFKEVPPALAQRGDLVVLNTEQGRVAGVVWGLGVWVTTPDGVRCVRKKPDRAWRVE